MADRFLAILALAVVLSVLAGAGGCSEGNDSNTPGQRATPDGTSRADRMRAPQGAEEQVKIDNFTFDPPTLTVAAGTKVTWVNRDDVPHTATSTAKPKSFDSGTLDTDQQFSHVFTKPGTYDYFCAVHPKMAGRILVK
ncbi:MAG: cupredoxin domain-containing protein [Alphaproteobacteria bacterium]|nr:cupredoxin domain-containing protein [Alphaproteobacteria bacterium]